MNKYDEVSPDRSLFWLTVKWVAFVVAVIVVIRFLLMPLFVADKLVNREVQKFDAETSAQVYDNSRQYQQGINRDVARYCREHATAEGPARIAVANLIRSTIDTYQGELTPANAACVAQLGE